MTYLSNTWLNKECQHTNFTLSSNYISCFLCISTFNYAFQLSTIKFFWKGLAAFSSFPCYTRFICVDGSNLIPFVRFDYWSLLNPKYLINFKSGFGMISLLSFGTGLKFTTKGFCVIWEKFKYNYSVQHGSRVTIDGMSVTT